MEGSEAQPYASQPNQEGQELHAPCLWLTLGWRPPAELAHPRVTDSPSCCHPSRDAFRTPCLLSGCDDALYLVHRMPAHHGSLHAREVRQAETFARGVVGHGGA